VDHTRLGKVRQLSGNQMPGIEFLPVLGVKTKRGCSTYFDYFLSGIIQLTAI